MMGFKKKFSSFLPADARTHLQNALTVEWEGQGKTVLVDLPDANKHQNNEVEMAGLTSNSAAYGRLNDDDDDLSYSRPSRSNYHTDHKSETSQSQQYSDSHQSSSSSSANKHRKYPSYSSKTLPPVPPVPAQDPAYSYSYTQNPFETEYDSPQTSSSSSMFSNQSPYATSIPAFGNNDGYGYNNGSLNRKNTGDKKMPNPWSQHRADDIDFLGDLGGSHSHSHSNAHSSGRGRGLGSPTSSTGTRDSQSSSNYNSLENPFR
ncbi:uncharacterized protein I303_105221 [Kwoniella dejecticola CBS 10117]|uniref:Uncharacterized protein n=1 Tax=Kwoniella dejecticola CBS 10117 TaxID=1296121 RepID=A0A1A6A340_9TREE|nr:uncharacterized protein I303_05332 [Kwoniella dejecticola CBS 10117]OBR84474.1 hypothetical protein I303_05332 [Kwoniella dejecticola CBS 10117]